MTLSLFPYMYVCVYVCIYMHRHIHTHIYNIYHLSIYIYHRTQQAQRASRRGNTTNSMIPVCVPVGTCDTVSG